MKIAEEIVEAIIEDIKDRSGLGNEWEMTDDDIKEEIIAEWTKLVKKILIENQRYDDQCEDPSSLE